MSTTAGRVALPAGARVIRRLSPPDAPWSAGLVRSSDDAGRMIVDAALLADWDGWAAAPGGHVLGPLDVLRRPDGHDVLLPLCTERLDALLSRRGAGMPLTAGEAVTVGVSLLRGMVEIAQRGGNDAAGSWWLTDDGRPVFVDERDAAAADATTVDLLERIASSSSPTLAAALSAAADAVREPRALSGDLEQVEAQLFDAADPEAVATAPLTSAGLRQAGVGPDALPGADDAHRPWAAGLLATVDADFADAFSRVTTGLWRRLRRPASRRRRRPWALAGCLGAGVIAAGLLWPAPDGSATPGADATEPSAFPTASAITDAPTGEPAASPATVEPEAAVSGDLVTVTEALLAARRDCLASDDEQCLSGVMEDPGRSVSPGATDAVTGERVLTLLDEFGGVAVLRADATSGGMPAQLVVITNRDGKWLLREITDVAQQP